MWGQGILKGMGLTLKHVFRPDITFQYPLERRRDISPLFRGALNLRGMVKEDSQIEPLAEMPPCTNACPAHIDVRGYVGLIAEGKFLEAVNLIREACPLPGVCGRICPAPCERACRRGEEDEAIAIRILKRFVADYELKLLREGKEVPLPKPVAVKDQRVAIMGAGPAGLTAAYYLARLGYPVTIFEKLSVAGGMLAVGVPDYRLPRDILQAEVDYILRLGVELKLNTAVEDIESLFEQKYQAIFLAGGAHFPLKLAIAGEELEGVIPGEVFLRDAFLSKKVKLGQKVAIVGGGNTAIDCSRVALRKGAKNVKILYRRSRAEMPALDQEIEEAMEEGVEFEYLVAPTRIIGAKGKVFELECTRMRLTEPDQSGRRRPVPIKGSEFRLQVDTIIPAISRAPEVDFLDGSGVGVTKRGTIATDPLSGATSRVGIFAGGEASFGPTIAIEAIADGKRAAFGIHQYLSGKGEEPKAKGFTRDAPVGPEKRRQRPVFLPPLQRIKGFDEVESGLIESQAVKEAERCLSCFSQRCVGCEICAKSCPTSAIEIKVGGNRDRQIEEYNLDWGKCIFCGICVENCPTKTLFHTPEYELAVYELKNLIRGKEKLLNKLVVGR